MARQPVVIQQSAASVILDVIDELLGTKTSQLTKSKAQFMQFINLQQSPGKATMMVVPSGELWFSTRYEFAELRDLIDFYVAFPYFLDYGEVLASNTTRELKVSGALPLLLYAGLQKAKEPGSRVRLVWLTAAAIDAEESWVANGYMLVKKELA